MGAQFLADKLAQADEARVKLSSITDSLSICQMVAMLTEERSKEKDEKTGERPTEKATTFLFSQRPDGQLRYERPMDFLERAVYETIQDENIPSFWAGLCQKWEEVVPLSVDSILDRGQAVLNKAIKERVRGKGMEVLGVVEFTQDPAEYEIINQVFSDAVIEGSPELRRRVRNVLALAIKEQTIVGSLKEEIDSLWQRWDLDC